MYVRVTPRRNKDGSEVRYLQLAHNTWDLAAKRSKVQVIYNFSREDTANRQALERLVASVTRFLDPDAALSAVAEGLEFTESRAAVSSTGSPVDGLLGPPSQAVAGHLGPELIRCERDAFDGP